MTQIHVPFRACGFESRPGHYAVMPQMVTGPVLNTGDP